MNAGANGQQTKDVLRSVEAVTSTGELITKCVDPNDDKDWGYRSSPFQRRNKELCFLTAAHIELKEDSMSGSRMTGYLSRLEPYEQNFWCILLTLT